MVLASKKTQVKKGEDSWPYLAIYCQVEVNVLNTMKLPLLASFLKNIELDDMCDVFVCFVVSEIPEFGWATSDNDIVTTPSRFTTSGTCGSCDWWDLCCWWVLLLQYHSHRIHVWYISCMSTYIYHKHQPNVGIYAIHGSYGITVVIIYSPHVGLIVFIRGKLKFGKHGKTFLRMLDSMRTPVYWLLRHYSYRVAINEYSLI